jgi:hypothetical protein
MSNTREGLAGRRREARVAPVVLAVLHNKHERILRAQPEAIIAILVQLRFANHRGR